MTSWSRLYDMMQGLSIGNYLWRTSYFGVWVEWGSGEHAADHAEVVSTTLSREAGFRASLYSKSSGPGFRFSVPRYMTLGQVILPLMTSASQSVNGLNHSPCASDC